MKKLAFFSVAALLAGISTQAFAYNMIHPFWSPAEGQGVSRTSFDFSKTKYKNTDSKNYGKEVVEEVEYSFTDAFSVFGNLGRSWSKSNGYGSHNKNDIWSLGASYTAVNDGKHFANVWGEYYQTNRSYKNVVKGYNVVGTYGYNFDAVTPYVKVSFSDTLNLGSENDESWELRAAAYKEVVQDIGVTVGASFQRNSDMKAYYALAQVGYQVTPTMAVSVYGNYLLNDDWESDYRYYDKKDYSYTVGAQLSVGF